MKTIEDLFENINTFRRYIPYVDSNVTFQELNANGNSAIKQVCLIITIPVFDAVVDYIDIRDHILTAVANLTMSKQLVFTVMKQRKQEVDVYKHELEAMRRSYIENYYSAMDSLLESLEKLPTGSAWKETDYCKMIGELRIKSATAFDALYRIDCSYLYYFRTIPIQQEILDNYVSSYYGRVSDSSLERLLDRILAKMTVATSLRRFDIIEFPSTIRNLFDDSKTSRQGSDEYDRLYKLSELLMEEAKEQLRGVDLVISSSESGVVDTESSFNRPGDKIILM